MMMIIIIVDRGIERGERGELFPMVFRVCVYCVCNAAREGELCAGEVESVCVRERERENVPCLCVCVFFVACTDTRTDGRTQAESGAQEQADKNFTLNSFLSRSSRPSNTAETHRHHRDSIPYLSHHPVIFSLSF